MNFDPAQIAVPFRMQPGLRRMGTSERHLTALQPGSTLHLEKRAVVHTGAHLHAMPGFDPRPALGAIQHRARQEGLQTAEHADALADAYEQDFAVLDGATGRLAWLCVCTPSHWAPEEKIGLDFAAVHAPVADGATLQAASAHLTQLATAGDCWERHVWTVSPSARFDQHPHRHARTPWPTSEGEAFAAACHLRAERQTFFPVGGGTRQAVFTIRVMIEPLTLFARDASAARRLHDAIGSMSDAVLAYKGLTDARAPLLRWLASRLSPTGHR
jgi:hypothetical protein